MSAPGTIPFTRAVGTTELAKGFLDAAAAQNHDSSPPSLVAYFLYGHALELAFKAVLIVHGTTDQALRQLRHNLAQVRDAAAKAAPSGTIPIDDCDLARITLLTAYYEAKALEYIETGAMHLPVLHELRATTEKLVSAIVSYVDTAVRGRLQAERAV